MQTGERHSQRRWVVVHLYEDVHEDKLAKDEEIIKGRAHPNEKRSYTYKESQNSTASKQVIEVSET